MARTRRGLVGVLFPVALTLAVSCTGGHTTGSPATSEATDPPATTPLTTVVPGTMAAPITSTTSATTTTTTSTSPTTTTPTTPTTTTTTTTTELPIRSLADLEAEVAAAYDDIYEGYWACLRAPLECDTSWLVEGSGSGEAMQNTMQALADRARFVGDDPVGYYVIESIEFDDTRTEATVTSCWWSTAVLYTTPIDPNRPPGPDNPPTVVNNTPGSGMQADVLAFFEDKWRSEAGWLLDDGSRIDTCGGDAR